MSNKNYVYSVIKMTARKVFNAEFKMNLTAGQIENILVNEPDNGYFGIIRRLTNKQSYLKSTDPKNPVYMNEIIFLDCSYDNKKYNQECLDWAKQHDREELKKLNDIKKCLEKKNWTEEIQKKLEKIEFSISKYNRVFDRYEKKNKDTITYEENLDLLIDTGFILNGIRYYLVGMSGNMARHGIKGFVSEDIYDDADNTKKINALMYHKKKLDIAILDEMMNLDKFGYSQYLSNFFKVPISLLCENKSLIDYLEKHVNIPMKQVKDRKTLIETINIRRNRHLIKDRETINCALNNELHLPYKISSYKGSEVINGKRKKYNAIWMLEKINLV